MAGEVLAELTLEGEGQFRKALNMAAESIEDTGDEAAGTSVSISRLAENMDDLVAPSAVASNRVDAVGDEMTEMGAKAGVASGGVAGLRASMFGLSGSITSVLPAVAGIGTALTAIGIAAAPVVTGLAGVAAGFAAVGAVAGAGLLAGAVTHMEELKGAVETAKAEVKSAIKPVGDLFGPVLLQGVRALPKLVKRIVAATGSLKPFRDALLEIGDTAMTAIPQAAGALADFARQLLPLVTKATKGILNGLAPAIRFLSGEVTDLQAGFDDAAGPFRQFWERTRGLRNAIAPVLDQIQRFAKLAVIAGAELGGRLLPVFTPLVEGLGNVLKAVNDTIAALLGVGDATDNTALKIRSFAGTLRAGFQTAVGKAESTVKGFKEQLDNTFGALQPIVSDALGKVQTTVGRITGKMETVWDKHGGKVKGAVRDAFNFAKSHPKKALATLATVIVPGPLSTIVDAFKENWGKVERNTRTTMTQLEKTTRTAMDAVEAQIVTPLQNSESKTRTSLGQMQTEFTQTFSAINSAVSRLLGVALDVQNRHVAKVGKLWRTHLQGEDGILANARTAFNALWKDIIKPRLDRIQAFWNRWGDEIVAVARVAFDLIATIARRGLDLLLTTINVTLDLISGDWEGAWTNIKGFLKRTWNDITGWLKRTGKTLFGESFGKVIQAGINAIEDFGNWLFYNSFIKDLFNDMAGWIKSTGKSLVKGAYDAVVSGIETAVDWLIGTGDGTLYGDVTGALSSLAGWVDSSGESQINSAFGSIASAVQETLNGIDLSSITSSLNDVFDAASDALSEIDSIPSSVTSAITLNIKKNFLGGEDEESDNEGESNDNEDDSDSGNGNSSDDGVDYPDSLDEASSGSDDNFETDVSPDANNGDATGGSSNNDSVVGDSDVTGGYFSGFASGGLTQGEGLAYLHPNEAVMGVEAGAEAIADAMDGGRGVVIEEINVDADSDMSEADLMRAVRREFDRELQRLSSR
jgi:phage-related protein